MAVSGETFGPAPEVVPPPRVPLRPAPVSSQAQNIDSTWAMNNSGIVVPRIDKPIDPEPEHDNSQAPETAPAQEQLPPKEVETVEEAERILASRTKRERAADWIEASQEHLEARRSDPGNFPQESNGALDIIRDWKGGGTIDESSQITQSMVEQLQILANNKDPNHPEVSEQARLCLEGLDESLRIKYGEELLKRGDWEKRLGEADPGERAKMEAEAKWGYSTREPLTPEQKTIEDGLRTKQVEAQIKIIKVRIELLGSRGSKKEIKLLNDQLTKLDSARNATEEFGDLWSYRVLSELKAEGMSGLDESVADLEARVPDQLRAFKAYLENSGIKGGRLEGIMTEINSKGFERALLEGKIPVVKGLETKIFGDIRPGQIQALAEAYIDPTLLKKIKDQNPLLIFGILLALMAQGGYQALKPSGRQ